MNMGTKVNEIIKSQGFDHHAYPGRTSSYSTATGLKIMMFAYTSNATHFNIDQQSDGNYSISVNLKPQDTVLAQDIAEDILADTFKKIVAEFQEKMSFSS